MGWVIHKVYGKLVYSPENYEIDLRRLATRDDIKAALRDLEKEPFATPGVINEAQGLADQLSGVVAGPRQGQATARHVEVPRRRDSPRRFEFGSASGAVLAAWTAKSHVPIRLEHGGGPRNWLCLLAATNPGQDRF